MSRQSKIGWPEELRGRSRKRLVSSGGPTANDTTHLLFAVEIADKLVELEPNLIGGTITVSAFTPCSSDPEAFGKFLLRINKNRKDFYISVSFPTGRPQPNMRQGLDVDSVVERATGVCRENVFAASWDEAWLIVCEIGQMMKARSVKLAYGEYEYQSTTQI